MKINSIRAKVLGLEGAAVSCGDPHLLWEWSGLNYDAVKGQPNAQAIANFERRLLQETRRNHLDDYLPDERVHLVLGEPPSPAPDADLRYFENSAAETLGFFNQ